MYGGVANIASERQLSLEMEEGKQRARGQRDGQTAEQLRKRNKPQLWSSAKRTDFVAAADDDDATFSCNFCVAAVIG